MSTQKEEFLQCLQEADMVLIGIGEEFDQLKKMKQTVEYAKCREKLEGSENSWLIPALNMLHDKQEVFRVLSKFAELIAGKNYFVVSISTNDKIQDISWREGRLVMPCGGSRKKQCIQNCGHEIMDVTENDWDVIKEYVSLLSGECEPDEAECDLGTCPACGKRLVLNSIYTEKYNENGYLDQWQVYTKWLQGSLNRKLLVLELGVGLQCPSVIRWPFEKIAFFNQKASFWRVNEKLYQLSEELNGKGTSISMNAIDWLRDLC